DIATGHLPDCQIDHVFHLAARTFVPSSWADPAPFYATNVMGTVNVAQLCRSQGASLTFMSSYMYGVPQVIPINEDHPLVAFNPYGHSKLLAEDVCRFYSRQFGINVAVVRPFNIFGPGQGPDFLIPTIIAQALSREASQISIADDRPRRDYLFVEDLVELLL